MVIQKGIMIDQDRWEQWGRKKLEEVVIEEFANNNNRNPHCYSIHEEIDKKIWDRLENVEEHEDDPQAVMFKIMRAVLRKDPHAEELVRSILEPIAKSVVEDIDSELEQAFNPTHPYYGE